MKKSIGIIFVVLFFGLCLVPSLGIFSGRTNTNSEKRTLAVMPDIITNQGINGEFTKQYDDYFTDNFAFRSDLITLDAFLYADVFGQSVSDQVIVGKDGWLFFEPAVNDYKKTDLLTDNEIYRIYRTLCIQKLYLENNGIDFIFTVAPNKESIYGAYMPDRYLVEGGLNNFEKLSALFADQNFDYVNLHEVLRSGREAGSLQLYHKMDTHWNNAGAMLAFNALLTKVAALDNSFLFDSGNNLIPHKEISWYGDLSGMLYPTANLLDMQYIFDVKKKYTALRPIKSLEDLTIQTTCPTGSLDLLMFRDSFANALIPLFSNAFASVNYSRAVPYDYTQIDTGTDVVILEIAERNLSNIIKEAPIVPTRQIDLNVSLVQAGLETKVKTEDQGGFIRIAGLAILPQYSQDANYDIYIRLQTGDKTYTFETFPILEDGYFPEDEDKANAAFSMLLDKNSLPEGEYMMTAIVYDQTGYSVGPVSGGAVTIKHSDG